MWISRREVRRIEREASDCRKRESEALARLKEERERADRLALAVLDLAAKKLGVHAVSPQVLPSKEEPPETADAYHERLKRTFPQEWEYYQQVAASGGRSEVDALDWLVRMAEGRPMPFQEAEN